MTIEQPAWSLVVTAPNLEFKVAEKLTRLEIEYLLIRRRVERILHGQKISRFATAFPRYVFVRVHDAWEKVLGVNGVVDFVRIGSKPAVVSHEVIEQMRSRLDHNGALPVVEKSRFTFGQKVRIVGTSVYAGRDAIFQYQLINGRACVLWQWFDALRCVEVDDCDLMAIEDYRSARNKSRSLRRKKKRYLRRFTDRPLQVAA